MSVQTVVQIAPDIASKIKEKIATGNYPDADAVIRDAMDLLDERDSQRAWLLAALEEGERGPFHEFTPARMSQIRQRARDNARNGKPISDAVLP